MRSIFMQVSTKVFALLLVCIFFIIAAFCVVSQIRAVRQERVQYASDVALYRRNAVESIDDRFAAILHTASSVFSSRWFAHYRNNANLYADEFDVLTRSDISYDLRIKIMGLDFVHDILIITPSMDHVISKTNWLSLEDYHFFNKTVLITAGESGQPPDVAIANPAYGYILFGDIAMRKEKTIICVLLDKQLFASFAGRVLGDTARYARIALGEDVLYEIGTPDDTLDIYEARQKNIGLSMQIGTVRYEDVVGSLHSVYLAAQLIIAFFVSAVLAVILARISAQPILQLLRRVSGEDRMKPDEAVHVLGTYMDSMYASNMLLSEKNEQLSAKLERFTTDMKDEMFFALVTGRSALQTDPNIRDMFPWLSRSHAILVALIAPETDFARCEPSAFTQAFEGRYAFQAFNILYNNLCYVFWFAEGEDAAIAWAYLASALGEAARPGYACAISPVLEDAAELTEAFLSLKSSLNKQRQSPDALSPALQLRIISNIKNNDVQACMETLRAARELYKADHLMMPMMLTAMEYGIHMPDHTQRYLAAQDGHDPQATWQALEAFAIALIEAIHASNQQNLELIGRALQTYVEEHYCDTEMSLQALSDAFSMEYALASRTFKAHTGVSFTDHLLGLRMERAKELLLRTDQSIATIGKQVGYVNYLSFKRAFTRYEGISPLVYREQRQG